MYIEIFSYDVVHKSVSTIHFHFLCILNHPRMRALLQRVSSASVTVEGSIVGQINQGILALIGISRDDTFEDTKWLVQKILNLRMFDDEKKKAWNGSVKSLGLELLIVSQFTLHASCKKPKPDFHRSMGPVEAKQAYDNFVLHCQKEYSSSKIQTGTFGAMMSVALVNDGPVTLWLDSHNRNDEEWPSLPMTTNNTTGSTSSNNSSSTSSSSHGNIVNDTLRL